MTGAVSKKRARIAARRLATELGQLGLRAEASHVRGRCRLTLVSTNERRAGEWFAAMRRNRNRTTRHPITGRWIQNAGRDGELRCERVYVDGVSWIDCVYRLRALMHGVAGSRQAA